jgi:GntR family transcriptional regulator
MRHRIVRDSPLPIYHQIAEALRNAIAVGELAPGERLPAVRDAAEQWGVNLHTVRRAYRALQGEGLVRIDGARGTAVTGRAAVEGVGTEELDGFVASFVQGGRERYGLTAVQLAQLLLRGVGTQGAPVVHVLECSRTQAEGHCAELMERWRVDARPLVLSETAALPAGVVIGTYFHYNDVRQRWPGRLEDVRFVAIAPDAALAGRLRGARAGGRGGARLLVCELEEAKAVNIAADLSHVFSADDWRIEPRVLESAAALPRRRAGDVVLVSPRVWGALTPGQRERVVHIRYCIRPHELDALGESYGWERAESARSRKGARLG